jgi:hypothetical protein
MQTGYTARLGATVQLQARRKAHDKKSAGGELDYPRVGLQDSSEEKVHVEAVVAAAPEAIKAEVRRR